MKDRVSFNIINNKKRLHNSNMENEVFNIFIMIFFVMH